MKRKLDIALTAREFKLEPEQIIYALNELIEDKKQHGFIDRKNNLFHHITESEHNQLISLMNQDRIPLKSVSEELEVPLNALKEWLDILLRSQQIEGIYSTDGTFFITQDILIKEIKESFSKSGKLGIKEASRALQIDEINIKKVIRSLRNKNELEGYYTTDNEFFITLARLEADIIDYQKEEGRFFIRNLAVKLGMSIDNTIELVEGLVRKKYLGGAITQKQEFISDSELEQSLIEAVLPYSRISISELAEYFGLSEKNTKLLIARAISKGIIAGSIDSVKNEFVKEAVMVQTPSPAPVSQQLIDVKRDYDYIGGDIRFKVALQNITKTTVSKISVLLNVPDQFQIDRNVQKVEILNPNETRGVDFIFTPLACGRGQIFGTVSYTDAFGEPHSITIRPKEVWVKCPLVKSQKTSSDEADSWRQELQKSTTTIDISDLSQLEAFRVGCEQIAALDLAEVERNETNFTARFSGIAKVTGNRLLVELSLVADRLILDVFTTDQKQATGLLAYMRNLIRISLDVSRKLLVKSEKLGVKVITAFQIAQGLFNICKYCEIRQPICDFLLLLKELVFKIHKEFPEIKFYSEAMNWQEELSKFDENAPIPEPHANNLEYDALQWLKEIDSIAENNSKIYLDSFDTPDPVRVDKILGGLKGIKNEIKQKEANYSIRVAHYLLIIYKQSGLCLFSYKFSPGEFDPDLLSGFLQAIQSFGTEFSYSEDSGVNRLSYKDFEIILEEAEFVRVALVGIGKITAYLQNRLQDFVKLFNSQYYEELKSFRGHVEVFRNSEELIKNLFGLPQARIKGGE
ncbi:MAG: PCI domain-containing protein [Candidatus Helarchaeota archaeon]